MESNFENEYRAVRGGGGSSNVDTGAGGFYERRRGLIEVSGGEAVMFLNGLITNDVKKLEPGRWMTAAFPNAQGRLLALVRVLRFDDKFLFETDATTYEKVLENLSRFTMAGDFKVNDLTEDFTCVSVRSDAKNSKFRFQKPESENEIARADYEGADTFLVRAFRGAGSDYFVPKNETEDFIGALKNDGLIPLGEEVREVLRVENGEPLYGVDVDETTVVLETGLDEAVSFNKGCYIGQEIIARIHFRGHVAKKLTGLILTEKAQPGDELKSTEGKNAGRITSVAFSPALARYIALAFVRYDFLAEGTELKANDSISATVKNLPFIGGQN